MTQHIYNKVAVVIPAFNESVVLANSLRSALAVVNKEDIYVVDDGSNDNTFFIALKFTKNILHVPGNKGKASAINAAVKHFDLVNKYDYILPLDADTRVSPDFLTQALPVLEADTEKKYICVIGKVLGNSHNWLTSYRMWEYEISQRIHKAAQEKEGAIIVCSGCATLYRSSLFSMVEFPTDTVTEDMDLTFLIHRESLGQIAFAPNATVVTQDPQTLTDYINQVKRWNKGFWQCLKKHNAPWGGKTLDFELALSTVEGLSSGVLVLTILGLFPLIWYKEWSFLAIPFALDFFIFFLPSIYFTMFVHSNTKIFKYIPQFYFLRSLNSLIFLYSFLDSLFNLKKISQWKHVPRYHMEGAF